MTAILEPPAVREAAPQPAAFVEPSAPTMTRPAAPPVEAGPAPVRPPRPRRTLDRVRAHRGLALLTLATFVTFVEVQPAPDGPQPVPSASALLVGNAVLLALFAVVGGSWTVRKWAPWAGVVFGGLLAVDVGLCPVTGHHVIGGWWYAQVALAGVLLLAPAALLAARRTGRLR